MDRYDRSPGYGDRYRMERYGSGRYDGRTRDDRYHGYAYYGDRGHHDDRDGGGALGWSAAVLGGALLAAAGGWIAYRAASGGSGGGSGRRRAGAARRGIVGALRAPFASPVQVRRSVTVGVDAGEAYGFWRDLERLPEVMPALERVEVLESGLSRWTVRGPGDAPITWEAETTADVPNERIAWRSLPDADVANEGEVRFRAAPRAEGTEVHVRLRFEAPFGQAGRAAAALLGDDPSQEIARALHAFKALLETGVPTTIRGQPSGRDPEGGSREHGAPVPGVMPRPRGGMR